jgi:hypothetical protein
LHWTRLEASRLRRAALLCAGALSVGAVAALAWAAAVAPGIVRAALVAAASAALAVVVIAIRRPRPEVQVRLGPDGSIWTRCGPDEPEVAALPGFLSPWLLVLRHGRRHIAIWRDQLPARQFGRLGACVRWHVDRAGLEPINGRIDPNP